MPHDPSMRPAWLIRIGLFLYDHLARREWLPASRAIDLQRDPAGAPLKAAYRRGFEYSDGWVDDARLVVLCAVDAAARGATVRTRTACVEARARGGGWWATLRGADGEPQQVTARALVNATGPWAAAWLRTTLGRADARELRLVKGSHIVVPRLFDHDRAYILQGADRRIVFAIPYEGDFTLIGTTDVDFAGDPGRARADAAEIAYLCAQASRYFGRAVDPSSVLATYSGVRPLLDDAAGDPSAVTRDYLLEMQAEPAPLLSVWGGKITTFRKLAEQAADRIETALGRRPRPWTADAALPGGDLRGWIEPSGRPDVDIARFEQALRSRRPDLPPALARRWARSYGARVEHILAAGALGRAVAPGLHEAELVYLRTHEWAHDATDVLWRRTKLGLHFDADERAAVEHWFGSEVRSGAKSVGVDVD
jgi:glycerol-3-phosphate dehydrogenase